MFRENFRRPDDVEGVAVQAWGKKMKIKSRVSSRKGKIIDKFDNAPRTIALLRSY